MANPEHVQMFRSGVKSWNRWRTTTAEAPDLNAADLCATFLSGADLHGAKLRGAILRKTDLSGANLSGTLLSGADLVGANLTEADLSDADLRGAYLRAAVLRGTVLIGADLSGADLIGATLTGANLTDAHLIWGNLTDADLSGASLTGADLTGADLTGATLIGADLSGVALAHTVLSRIDLSAFCSANDVRHLAESPIDWQSVAKSLRAANIKEFLRRAGMPAIFIEYMVDCARSLDPEQLFSLMQSTFISYGAPDEAFARHLNQALFSNGVTTFFFPKDAEPGQRLHATMRDGVNKHDRIVLVCSRDSLDRKGVLNEIQETLAREARDGGASYLVPLALDNYVYREWQPSDPGVAQAVRDRVVADFRNADPTKAHDAASREIADSSFNEQLGRLLAALRRARPGA